MHVVLRCQCGGTGDQPSTLLLFPRDQAAMVNRRDLKLKVKLTDLSCLQPQQAHPHSCTQLPNKQTTCYTCHNFTPCFNRLKPSINIKSVCFLRTVFLEARAPYNCHNLHIIFSYPAFKLLVSKRKGSVFCTRRKL